MLLSSDAEARRAEESAIPHQGRWGKDYADYNTDLAPPLPYLSLLHAAHLNMRNELANVYKNNLLESTSIY